MQWSMWHSDCRRLYLDTIILSYSDNIHCSDIVFWRNLVWTMGRASTAASLRCETKRLGHCLWLQCKCIVLCHLLHSVSVFDTHAWRVTWFVTVFMKLSESKHSEQHFSLCSYCLPLVDVKQCWRVFVSLAAVIDHVQCNCCNCGARVVQQRCCKNSRGKF